MAAVVAMMGTLSADSAHAVTSSRVSGDDRYGTSAAISRSAFPDPTGVSRVFLVAGASFADGLAAGRQLRRPAVPCS